MALDGLYLAGDKSAFDIADVVTGSEWTQTIDGAPTLRLDVAADIGKVKQLTRALSATVRGELYTLVRVEKRSRRSFKLELESAASVALKNLGGEDGDTRTATAGRQSRRQFIDALAAQVPGLNTRGEPYTVRSDVELSTEDDTHWDAAQRIAQDIGRRVFVRRNHLWFASDDWLLARPPFANVREQANGVDAITWTIDVGQDVAELDVTARSFELYAGDTVRVQGEGPADGGWIVSEVRGSLHRPTVNVRLIQPEPTLPEPQAEAVDEGGVGGDIDLTLEGAGPLPGGTSDRVRAFIAAARRAEGRPYVWGGESLTSGADCSGLMVAALRAIGVDAPRFTSHTMHQYGRRVSVATGIRTPGAALHKQGHTAISLGNGRTFEASSRARPIGSLNANGRGFTSAVLFRWLF